VTHRRKPDRGNARLQRILDDAKPEGQEYLRECSICGGPFDASQKGTSEGQIGGIPVTLCNFCTPGIALIVKGTEDDQENGHVLPGIQGTD